MNDVIFARNSQVFQGALYGLWTADYWDSNAGKSYVGYRLGVGFNAANFDGIYGKSSTVIPLSIKCTYFIKY